jgi:hypothetical protein
MLEIKMNIPSIHPFSWDETFMQLDRLCTGASIRGYGCSRSSETLR